MSNPHEHLRTMLAGLAWTSAQALIGRPLVASARRGKSTHTLATARVRTLSRAGNRELQGVGATKRTARHRRRGRRGAREAGAVHADRADRLGGGRPDHSETAAAAEPDDLAAASRQAH